MEVTLKEVRELLRLNMQHPRHTWSVMLLQAKQKEALELQSLNMQHRLHMWSVTLLQAT